MRAPPRTPRPLSRNLTLKREWPSTLGSWVPTVPFVASSSRTLLTDASNWGCARDSALSWRVNVGVLLTGSGDLPDFADKMLPDFLIDAQLKGLDVVKHALHGAVQEPRRDRDERTLPSSLGVQ